MKIIMLSMRDCCASGYHLCEAIRENTDHEIELFQWISNTTGHPMGTIVRANNAAQVQAKVNEADVVHVKGDLPWKNVYPGKKNYQQLRINHKPIVLTLSGTLTREVRFGGYGQCSRKSYPAKLITAHEPDLKHDWVDILTYYPQRSTGAVWRRQDPPVLMHIPSNRLTKDTEFVKKIVGYMKKNVIFELLEKIPYSESIEAKKRATLYFDQFVIGWYGNSGVEAMNYGVPVVSWVSEFSRQFANPAVITSDGGARRWAELLDWVLEKDMAELSRTTKEYFERFHSYESVAKQWDEIYRSLR